MSEADVSRTEELFHQALEQDPGSRDSFLDQACAGDAELRRRVENLLRADDCDEQFLEPPPARAVGDALRRPASLATGQSIGSYRVLRSVGSGGMGEVYLAERADPSFQQKVAVKVIRRGDASEEILGRFQQERQTLARLEHPFIARFLDAGATEVQAPYLVMEFVEGETIVEYCDRRKLSVTERVLLFRKVCEAVIHAHQNLIVHRDLKPGNILVTADGTPKLLDFGIAKVLQAEGHSEEEGLTETGRQVMTLEYASPEQIRGAPVTTATDVYSLTVVLYELLCGTRPFRRDGRSTYEVEKAICEEDPRPPSTTAGVDDGATREDRSRRRGTIARRLRKDLAGDLDTIVMKGLRKNPAERYRSVEQLSEDLRRYLAGLPIAARRDTWRYRAGKFVNRNRFGFAMSAILVVMLAVIIVGHLHQAARDRESLAAIRRLSDLQLYSDYVEEERQLYPAIERNAAAMVSWLEKAEALASRLSLHERTLEELREGVITDSAGPDKPWVFATDEEQWEHDTLAELVARLRELAEPEHGLLARVRDRLRWAREVEQRTIAEYELEWDDAIASIADPEDCPKYGGLQIVPQLGLVPLWRDEESGLWEFLHLASGEEPEVGDDGRWEIREATGIVFVLIPGGTCYADEEYPANEPIGESGSTAPQIEIEPFFLSKYEMTQGQWMRTGDGTNPSSYHPEYRLPSSKGGFSLAHPVESVSSAAADRRMLELGLELPIGELWHYAARAWSDTTWWSGDDPRSLAGFANLVDATARNGELLHVASSEIFFDDGYITHAPVDSFDPNPFGLHNILGNVAEIARAYRVHLPSQTRRPPDSWEPEERYAIRGGSFSTTVRASGPRVYTLLTAEFIAPANGVRPMRRVE